MSETDVVIYHNPRCTKSRQALALLRAQGVEPRVIEYLRQPIDADTLTRLVEQLGVPPRDLVRKKEFRALGMAEPENDPDWISLMISHPKIIERPIVVCGQQARLGRPPENVLELLA